jgi:hypothetical protein
LHAASGSSTRIANAVTTTRLPDPNSFFIAVPSSPSECGSHATAFLFHYIISSSLGRRPRRAGSLATVAKWLAYGQIPIWFNRRLMEMVGFDWELEA